MAVFEASPEGFRAQNLGRPAAHLVRELVQNVLDEAATTCVVEIKHSPMRGVTLKVTDDVLGGIRDETLIFTIWQSDKADSPTKRGRMGRGLKEIVSVADRTVVSTQGRPHTIFTRDPLTAEWKRKSSSAMKSPAVGTVVEASVRSWTAKDCKEAIEYLKRIRPPDGIAMSINGEPVKPHPVLEVHDMFLPSVTFVTEDGERKVSNRGFYTTVNLFSEDKAWIYEMGLPIEEIDFPLSIDVMQRIPLREQRDTLITWYRAELFAKLVSARIATTPIESLRDSYILKAAEQPHHLSELAKQKIALAWTEGKPFATTPKMMSVATGQHIPVVNLRTLPEAVRELVRVVGKDVKEVLRERSHESCPIDQEPESPWQRRLIETWEWIAEGINRPCQVVVADGMPGAQASFSRDLARLTIYRKELGDGWFKKALGANQLALLIHELSHWRQLEDSHGVDFHSDAEHVGADTAVWLMEHYYEAQKLAGFGT